MLENNPDFLSKKLETNTIYYIEKLVRRFIYKNREKIKRTKVLKGKVIIILDFLIQRGSTIGYMLREHVV